MLALVPNPEYAASPYELMFIDGNGSFCAEKQPFRFRERDLKAVNVAVELGHWATVALFAIPTHIEKEIACS